jgi:hypothetical protein
MPTMDSRTWSIIAIAVLVILVAGYYLLQPTAQTPTGTATPPATTEQPAQPAPAN